MKARTASLVVLHQLLIEKELHYVQPLTYPTVRSNGITAASQDFDVEISLLSNSESTIYTFRAFAVISTNEVHICKDTTLATVVSNPKNCAESQPNDLDNHDLNGLTDQ